MIRSTVRGRTSRAPGGVTAGVATLSQPTLQCSRVVFPVGLQLSRPRRASFITAQCDLLLLLIALAVFGRTLLS